MPPCPVVPDPVSGARPLGDGVGSGDLGTEVPQFVTGESPGMRSVPPSQLFVKVGARPRAL